MHLFKFGIYFLFLISTHFHGFVNTINEAPAKVTLLLQVSKLSLPLANDPKLKLCVDKGKERCFWSHNEVVTWDGEQFKDISYLFFISNMATELTLDVKIEYANKKISYERKPVNLMKISSKTSYKMHSLNLESFVSVTVKHECENGYYPIRQCTKACFPMSGESECDDFGNKICKHGLKHDIKLDRCIGDNCLKLSIRCRNGHCVNKDTSFECVCLEGYYGKYCEFQNPCFPNPCSNGGSCNADFMTQTFICSCQPPFTGTKCHIQTPPKCLCPGNLKCVATQTSDGDPCRPDQDKSDNRSMRSSQSQNKEPQKVLGLESGKKFEWTQVTMTTIIVTAIGCVMLILCVCVSLYVFCYTRDHRNVKRRNHTNNSPSALYSEFTPKCREPTFKRSSSLDDNSAYMATNSQILQTLPNTFTLSSTGYSLQSNSYQDNFPSQFMSFPINNGLMYRQQDQPGTPLILHSNYIKGSNPSTASNGSMSSPPALPPRSNDTELSSFGSLPKTE